MVIYKPFEQGIEVLGASMVSVIASLPSIPFIVEKYFKKADLPVSSEIKPDIWYSQEKWLQVFKVIFDKTGPNTLFNIGKKIPENAVFPTNLTSIEEALQSIDIAYHMNHRRNGRILYESGIILEGIGHYSYTKIPDQNKIIMTCENPYHCAFDKGIITAMAQKFEPTALIMHDNTKECRILGADSCTFIITW